MAVIFKGPIWGVQPFRGFNLLSGFNLFSGFTLLSSSGGSSFSLGIRSLFCRWGLLCSSSLYVCVYGDVFDSMGAFPVGTAVGTTTVARRDVVGGGTVEGVETGEDSL